MRPGTEPSSARTAVGLRVVLAAAALIGFSLAAWLFLAAPGGSSEPSAGAVTVGVICVVVAISAAVDLVVLAVRSARGDYRNN